MIDTHCHLTSERFEGQTDSLVQKALDTGVQRLVSIGVNLEDSQKVVDITRRYKGVYGAVGVHPLHIDDAGVPSVDQICQLAQSDKIVALGETGLDLYHGTTEDLDRQYESFWTHVEAGHITKKPIVVHTRSAFDQTKGFIAAVHKKYPDIQFLIHCYTGDWETAKFFLDHHAYISFSGIVTLPKNTAEIIDAAAKMPRDKILCETDAPFLAPVPIRGQMNQPYAVKYVYDRIIELRGEDANHFVQQVSKNAQQLFGWGGV